MTDEQILELAKSRGFSFDEDDETWFCFEKELLKFAALIYTIGIKVGYDEGCEQHRKDILGEE